MKIIHCLNHFFPEQIGGTEVYVVSLCKSLSLVNIESLVLIPNYGKKEDETYWVEGIKVLKYAEPSVVNRDLIMGKAVPSGLQAFLDLICKENPSVVHFHNIGQSIGITLHHLLGSKKLGYKIVATLHLAGPSCYSGTLRYQNQRQCDGFADLKKCTACAYSLKHISPFKQKFLLPVAMTAYRLGIDTSKYNSRLATAIGFPFIIKRQKEDMIRLAQSADQLVVLTKWYKEVLLLNGVPENKLVHIAQALPVQDSIKTAAKCAIGEEFNLVYIGRIIEEKGLHLIIEAFMNLNSADISLFIFGQQPDSLYTRDLIKVTSSYPNIIWKGILEPGSVVENLKGFDLLCIPSIVCEMSPLVIQEAFAAGIPVLASDVYGNAEQITDGKNGWLFNVNDSHDLKNRLQMLLENPGLLEEAKKNIPVVRSFEELASEYISLYTEITKQP